ncbi:hypothetical protein C7H19_15990 [Aphanothece hegewaldii CCALA 016]|uniref:Uncharacterized protein n=1 Tax=Aphanothece hegewaldii CCALA 016 TaxID=2107694 RepID=A0A2T1LVH4_9CHRO|nr:hypothetical protein [Aphanothece hegewaldii]PSF35733.1 hypothetical protein C7H19_15990 [Aphanothece hegewaldii CCALA 016]
MTKLLMSEQELANFKELLELAKETERKAEALAKLTLKLNQKYEKRIAEIRVKRRIQEANKS